MPFEFSKMHGLGNDYVFVETFTQELTDELSELARAVSNRNFGIGSDGLIVVSPSQRAAMKMRIFNADGSEAQMCGNGLRCAIKFAYERNLIAERVYEIAGELKKAVAALADFGDVRGVDVETGRGILKSAIVLAGGNKVAQVCVNMSEPILVPSEIPVNLAGDRIIGRDFDIEGARLKMTCVSMGNPHAVFFCDDIDKIDIDRLGPAIENHQLFPERVNVHFVTVLDRSNVRMITWERGSGRTLACGTGASAVCVAGVLEGRTERVISAELPGGKLKLMWNESDNCVYMLGPAEEVFRGQYLG